MGGLRGGVSGWIEGGWIEKVDLLKKSQSNMNVSKSNIRTGLRELSILLL